MRTMRKTGWPSLLCGVLGWACTSTQAEVGVRELGETPRQTLSFGVYWPPRENNGVAVVEKPLLAGEVVLQRGDATVTGSVLRLSVLLTRPSDETARARWNTRLAFPELDWMRYVRVWDREQRWLWPNLPYLLRLPGKEREARYGGIDPAKGVDNDFAAVLIRMEDESGTQERPLPPQAPLVSAEWHPLTTNQVDRSTVVHEAVSDEFILRPGKRPGRAGVWLVYADFMGAKPPPNWPLAPEFAGGILAYFEVEWSPKPDGGWAVQLRQARPKQATGFDWEGWVARTKAAADPASTRRLTE